jgi:hypothetical protein
VSVILPPADVLARQPCSCLFDPCQCDRITGLTPDERIAEQEAFIRRYWATRTDRLDEAIAAREQLVTQAAILERARVASLVAEAVVPEHAKVGMDAQTRGERRPRDLEPIRSREGGSPGALSDQARQKACDECLVKDGLTQYYQGAWLHPDCRKAWWARCRRAVVFLRATRP